MRTMRWLVPAVLLVVVGCSGQARQEVTEQESGVGVQWQAEFEESLQQARQEGKLVMVDVMASWCSPCKRLDEEVWSRSDVAELSRSFVPVRVDGDKRGDLRAKFAVSGYPTTLFLTPDGEEVSRVRGAVPYEDMLKAMQGALDKAKPAQ